MMNKKMKIVRLCLVGSWKIRAEKNREEKDIRKGKVMMRKEKNI